MERSSHVSITGRKSVEYDRKLQNLVPTLYIGLGGTGKNVLLRFRKSLFDEFKSPRPGCCRFLLLDGNEQERNLADGESEGAMAPARFEADQGEFIGCSVSESAYSATLNKLENEHDQRYKNWLHPNFRSLVPPTAVVQGAGTFRQAGRFQFFQSFARIREQIKKHLIEMFHFATQASPEIFPGKVGEVDSGRLEVVIVASLAGGTGSGMFMDMAYLIQDIVSNAKSRDPGDDRIEALKNIASHVTLIAFMPSVFGRKDPALARRHQQNAYASLLEMEHYSTFRPEETSANTNGDSFGQTPTGVEFRVNWTNPSGSERVLRRRPWDTCYLIDDINDRQPGKVREAEELFQMAADYLFLDFGNSPFAIAKRSTRSNHAQLQDRLIHSSVLGDVTIDGRTETVELFNNVYGSTFSSFGLAEILIDRERINRAASYRLAATLLTRRWLNQDHGFREEDFRTMARRDLDDGATPRGASVTMSFSPKALSKALYGTENGGNWPAQFVQELEDLAGENDRTVLLKQLGEVDAALARGGKARKTVDAQFERLAGRGAELGTLRQRLDLLARGRLETNGVYPVLELLKLYDSYFEWAEGVLRKWRKDLSELPRNPQLLARLQDAEKVPFISRWVAVRTEFARALEEAAQIIPDRARLESVSTLEKLYAELRKHVSAASQQGVDLHEPLRSRYLQVQEFLAALRKRTDERFRELLSLRGSDQKISLIPRWDDGIYDQQITLALIANPAVGPNENRDGADWTRVEKAVIDRFATAGSSGAFADVLAEWMADCRRHHEHREQIVEGLASACRTLLGEGLSLKQFANGRVIEFLGSVPEVDCKTTVKQFIMAAAPYFPRSAESQEQMGEFTLVCRNILGRSNGDAQQSRDSLQRVEAIIRGAATEKSTDRHLDEIHETEDLEPTKIALVRELAGFPLSLYSRLPELEAAYLDPALARQRQTCHIRYRETFEDLPDIVIVEDQKYRAIREYCDDVLRGIFLRFIDRTADDEMYYVSISRATMGSETFSLGMRLNRIVKHACDNPRIREYLRQRFQRWTQNQEQPVQLAVMYNAIQQSRDFVRKNQPLIPGEQGRKPLPVLNCLCRLLGDAEKELRSRGDEGEKWFQLLRDHDHLHDSDAHREAWEQRYPRVCATIAGRCLTPPRNLLVPIFQINAKGVESLTLDELQRETMGG